MIILACISLMLALIPCLLLLQNLRLYQSPPSLVRAGADLPGISVLIPARNEAQNIAAAIRSIQVNRDVSWELLILDDHSEDQTAEIVREMSARDSRVRLISGPPLSEGWNGKQHACYQLAQQARFPWLVFMDADVCLKPHSLSRMVSFVQSQSVALASGVPHQVTETLLERLLVPLIHFVLLGFLPLRRMRGSSEPACGAGCGQLFIASAAAYATVGGHSAIRGSRHDGVQLPRAFRRSGFRTDLFDATHIAVCRMYHNASEVWSGFVKNAHEGLAAPATIIPATVILFGGQVLPWLLLFSGQRGWTLFIAILGISASCLPRWVSSVRFKQSKLGALFHPAGVLLLITIQWVSFLRRIRGKSTPWKGRLDLSPSASKPLQQAS
ncbi:MAG: family glycosyltransferase [Verrucomicrobiales bacterium]|nr:family glycosyltransferase [Verrucomicrobiales bacterium]